jgi:hypothetical protein
MSQTQDASQFAGRVISALPRRTIRYFDALRAPFLSDRDSENICCPECGRRLPFTFAQNSGGGLQGTVVITLSRREHVAACLVDGPRSRHALPFTAPEVIDATRAIADRLRLQRWRGWSRLFQRALEGRLADERDRIEAAGQALEALLAYGPFGYMDISRDPDRHSALNRSRELARSDLDVLVASSGPHWRVRAAVLPAD